VEDIYVILKNADNWGNIAISPVKMLIIGEKD